MQRHYLTNNVHFTLELVADMQQASLLKGREATADGNEAALGDGHGCLPWEVPPETNRRV